MYRTKEITLRDITDCTALERLLDNMRAVIKEMREPQDKHWRLVCHSTSEIQEGSKVRDNPADFPNMKTVEIYDIHGTRTGDNHSEPIGLLVMRTDYYRDRHIGPTVTITAAGVDPAGECFDAAVDIAAYILGREL